MEIEVKFRISSPEEWEKRLDSLGRRIDQSFEEDLYFTPFNEREVLRLRKRPDYWLLTYKRLEESEAQLAREYEAQVSPGIEEVLEALGHKLVFRKAKERKTWRVGPVKANLDHVDELGDFIELEFLGQEREGLEELKRLAERLGLDWEERITKPYVRMLLETHKNH